ncbi:MAG: flavin reductase family protein [Firmicutes bacterium]|nr:flavin reductase family protein [Bacillota bacterium]
MQIQRDYKQAILGKYPEGVVIVVAKTPEGRYNPITLGWTMITSHEPPMFAISVGLTRYSRKVIEKAGEFVLSFPSGEMAEAALFYGTNSGRELDKMAEFPVATQPTVSIDSLLLSDAVANFECKLVSQLETGDHVIFVGEVLASHQHEDEDTKRLYTWAQGYKMGEAELSSD